MNISKNMKKLFVLAALALCLSCVKDNVESVSVEALPSSKIVGQSYDAFAGGMIVCFDEQAVTRVEAGVSRSGATRSGIEQFDTVLEQIGVNRIERVFIPNRFEERLRAEGMHRWYYVSFDENVDVEQVANAFAAVAEVDVVEYNVRLSHITNVEPTTFVANSAQPSSAPATRTYPAFNDPDLGKQWHYINIGDTSVFSGVKAGADINLGEAWNITAGDKRVIVAIVDDVVKASHPDLQDNMWVNSAEANGKPGVDDDNNGYIDDIYGVNFVTYQVNGATELMEGKSDHGTHVAGTVAAVNNNGKGGCGVAGGTGKGDGARLMSCQMFYEPYDSSQITSGWPSGTDVVAARAFQYAADNGAAIAQCSYGYPQKITADSAFEGSMQQTAIDYFVKYGGGEAMTGGIPIFAAGNESSSYSSYPGAYRSYISVTSMSCDYTPAYYTNYGPGSNVAAPGGDYLQKYYTDGTGQMNSSVYSTVFNSGTYDYKQGSSMACPHVSGVAALCLSHALSLGKKLSFVDLRNILLSSTHDIDRYCVGDKTSQNGSNVTSINLARFKGNMGVGYIDAFKALMNVQGTPCLTARLGVKQGLDLTDAIGGNPATITFIDGGVVMSQAAREKLGVEGDVTISETGKLMIKCTKPGSATIKIKFISGGDTLGSLQATGGMAVEQEVAIFARGFATNGGWL